MPAVYDRCLGPTLFTPYAEELARRAAALAPRSVLEVAAGTGIGTAALTAALPHAPVLATDLNATMVARGRERAPRARWEQADATALPLPDHAVDLAVCTFGVMFFPDRPAFLRETLRVLAPGGTLLLTVWDRLETCTLPRAFQAALTAVLPGRTPDFLPRVPHGCADPGPLLADAQAAGFARAGTERVTSVGSAASAEAVAEGFCLGTPLGTALRQRGDVEALRQQVAGELRRALGEGPVQGTLSAHVLTLTAPK